MGYASRVRPDANGGYTPATRTALKETDRVNPPDRVMRYAGHTTAEIFFDVPGTDVSAGHGQIYDVGVVTPQAVGRYLVEYQAAADADSPPLGTLHQAVFDLYEQTAGVYLTRIVTFDETEGGTATNDAADTTMNFSDGGAFLAGAVALNGADADAQVTVFVATATNVTHAAAWTAPAVLEVGHLYIMDALSDASRKFKITRIAS